LEAKVRSYLKEFAIAPSRMNIRFMSVSISAKPHLNKPKMLIWNIPSVENLTLLQVHKLHPREVHKFPSATQEIRRVLEIGIITQKGK
jgi:hypothetical protein